MAKKSWEKYEKAYKKKSSSKEAELPEMFEEEDVKEVMEETGVSRKEAVKRLKEATDVDWDTTKMEVQAERGFGENIGKKIQKLQKKKSYESVAGFAKGIGKILKKAAKKIDADPDMVLVEKPDDPRNPTDLWYVAWEEGTFEWAVNATGQISYKKIKPFTLEPYRGFSLIISKR